MDKTYKSKILYIDDNLIDRVAFGRYFKDRSLAYDYSLASSLHEAEELLDHELYDAVIIDYNLGDGTAFDLFERLVGIPFIIVTGAGDQEIAVKAMKAGAYDYIVKDNDSNHLHTIPLVVDNAINRKKVEEELRKYRTELEDLVQMRTADLRKEIEERKKVEKALRISEEKFSSVVKSAKDAIVTIDEYGKIVDWNHAANEIFGYSRQEAKGMEIESIIPDIQETHYRNTFKDEDKEDINSKTHVLKGISSDNAEIPLELTLASWQTNEGMFLTGIIRDISERRKKEEAILLQTKILTNINNMFHEVIQSRSYKEVAENCLERIVKVTGGRGGFLGKIVDGKLSRIRACSEEIRLKYSRMEDIDELKERTKILLNDSLAIRDGIVELRKLKKNEIDCLGLEECGIICIPIKEGDEVVSIVCIIGHEYNFTDKERVAGEHLAVVMSEILSRKKAEYALLESEERKDLALRGADLGMWDYHVGSNCVIMDERASEIMNMAAGNTELSIEDWIAGICQEDQENVRNALEIYKQNSEKMHQTEFRVKDSSAAYKWIMNRARVVATDSNKEAIRITGTMLDISENKEAEMEILRLNAELEQKVRDRTKDLEYALSNVRYENNERKKIQDRLEQSNYELKILNNALADESHKLIKLNEKLTQSEKDLKLANDSKDKFFSIIAHDLKNPLQGLLLSSELLNKMSERKDYEKIDKHIKRVISTTNILKNLLNNLLTWSRSQRGVIDFRPEYVDMRDMVLSTIQLCKMDADKKNIIIDSEVEEGLVVHVDKNMIMTVLSNIIFNAIKFTRPGGKVLCTASRGVTGLEVGIIDNGIGIDKEDINKLFRLDKLHTTIGTDNEKGTGLGLIICKEFIEEHGGKIWVESERERGSSFKFTIPKVK